ncbi:hypothetical protein B0H16DRAFT_1698109 [Mycena metata]|uniref:Uncharacterized protein n=1 Tax=Mycena metata TaxID=1033252 RepID=A0AAD7MP00_9AGAR|nr:hypothetical protein B0H16DRAFT_1698109 [Mycena metata]
MGSAVVASTIRSVGEGGGEGGSEGWDGWLKRRRDGERADGGRGTEREFLAGADNSGGGVGTSSTSPLLPPPTGTSTQSSSGLAAQFGASSLSAQPQIPSGGTKTRGELKANSHRCSYALCCRSPPRTRAARASLHVQLPSPIHHLCIFFNHLFFLFRFRHFRRAWLKPAKWPRYHAPASWGAKSGGNSNNEDAADERR